MSKKRTKYTSAFKTKLALELLQNESTIVQIASKHNLLPQNVQNWKKTFLANAEIALAFLPTTSFLRLLYPPAHSSLVL
jgi:putative transposase